MRGRDLLAGLTVFIKSFRHFANPCAELAMLVSEDTEPVILELLLAHDVVVVPVTKEFPYIRPERSSLVPPPEQLPAARLEELLGTHLPNAVPWDIKESGGIKLSRFFLAEAWFEAQAALPSSAAAAAAKSANESMVLFLDVRDVVFQCCDPFHVARSMLGPQAHELSVLLFEEQAAIGDSAANIFWAEEFGEAFPRSVFTEKFVAGGIFAATYAGFLRMIRTMREILVAFNRPLNDQGLVNFMLRSPFAERWPLPDFRTAPPSNPFFRNVYEDCAIRLRGEPAPGAKVQIHTDARHGVVVLSLTDGAGMLSRRRGQVAVLLHGYDRSAILRDALMERWVRNEDDRLLLLLFQNSHLETLMDLEVAVMQTMERKVSLDTGGDGCLAQTRSRLGILRNIGGYRPVRSVRLAYAADGCAAQGHVAAFLYQVNFVEWAVRLARAGLHSQEFVQTLAGLSRVPESPAHHMEGPGKELPGLSPHWLEYFTFLCLDGLCAGRSAQVAEERLQAAWELTASYSEFLGRNFPKGPPRDLVWLRELHWPETGGPFLGPEGFSRLDGANVTGELRSMIWRKV